MRSGTNALIYQEDLISCQEGEDEFARIVQLAKKLSNDELISKPRDNPVVFRSRALPSSPVKLRQKEKPLVRISPPALRSIPRVITDPSVLEDIPAVVPVSVPVARLPRFIALGQSSSAFVSPFPKGPAIRSSRAVTAIVGLLSIYCVAYTAWHERLPSRALDIPVNELVMGALYQLWPVHLSMMVHEAPALSTFITSAEEARAPSLDGEFLPTSLPIHPLESPLVESVVSSPAIHTPLPVISDRMSKRTAEKLPAKNSEAYLLSQADRLWRRGNKAQAISVLEDAYGLYPTSEVVIGRLGALYAQNADVVSLNHLLHRAEPLLAKATGVQLLKARSFLLEGSPKEALGILQSISTEPLLPEYGSLLATTYQALGQHSDALDVYWGLIQAEPRQGRWWVGVGVSLEATEATQHALLSYQKAIQYPLDVSLHQYAQSRITALSP